MDVAAAAAGTPAALALERVAAAYACLDHDLRITYANAEAERLLGAPRGQLLGVPLADAFPGADRSVERWTRRAAQLGRPASFEALHTRLGAWFEVRAVPVPGGVDVWMLDVSQRRSAQDELLRTAGRLQLLDAVGAQLSGRSAEDAVARLAQLVVPALGDWCVVSLVEPDGRLRDVGWWHADPASRGALDRYARGHADAVAPGSPLVRAVRSGSLQVLPVFGPADAAAAVLPGPVREALEELAPASAVVAPLRARGEALGVLRLGSGAGRPPLDADGLATVTEVADRAALALDGARAVQRAQQAQAAARAAEEDAARAVGRLRLLGDVGDALAASLESDGGAGAVPRLLLPVLGDWAVLWLAGPDGTLEPAGWAHRDPQRSGEVHRAARALASSGPVPLLTAVLRTGQPVVVPHAGATGAGDAALGAASPLASLAPRSVALLPVPGGAGVLGVLLLASGDERGPLGDAGLETAAEAARRVGAALDVARLRGQQRRLSEALQRSLLTEPPQLQGLRVAVRYAPAASDAQVGGDWYDAFVQPSGAVVLAIGDVVGHDTEAAAAMGQLRGLLRGIAHYGGGGPASVLAGLDAAMAGLHVQTTATCLVARLEQTSVERGLGLRRLRWSSAGHPPAAVLTADGRVSVLDDDPDLLLGLDPLAPRTEREAVLEEGSTVLLYTDGLVERRDQGLDEGIARLCHHLAQLAGRPLGELCDALLAALADDEGAGQDDVALVAVRLEDAGDARPATADRLW